MHGTIHKTVSNDVSTLLLAGAIVAGSLIGTLSESTGVLLGEGIDYTILTLILLLFFEFRIESLFRRVDDLRFVAIAWCANFILVPMIGFLIASIFLAGKPLFLTGLMIYFMAPCTDWFLGFTRLAKGNTSLGALLIPINMLSQLLLYPVYLALFTRWQPGTDISIARDTLIDWFIVPFLGAGALRLLLGKALPARGFQNVLDTARRTGPLVMAVLIVAIFSANIVVIRQNLSAFPLILAAVFVFFLATYWLGDRLSVAFGLAYPEHALLTMTTAARNAPLMLGVTVVAIPDQPLIHAAIVIGMLVEFPHLAALKHVLLRQRAQRMEHWPLTAHAASHSDDAEAVSIGNR